MADMQSTTPTTPTTPKTDATPLYVVGAMALFLFARKRSADTEDGKRLKAHRQLMLGVVGATFLVISNRQALAKHLPFLVPLVASNLARELGSSNILASLAAIAAYILLTNTADA